VAGRLKLRRGIVVATEPLTVEVDGEGRPAWADEVLLGEVQEGDEVIVNTAALDLALGSGGFDVVHANLTRGLEGGVEGDTHVMKLNYSSLQHPVDPVEHPDSRFETHDMGAEGTTRSVPVAVLPLHGHLAPAAWAAAQAAPDLRVGYVQTGGGALPGSLSRDVVKLREEGFLCGHITAAPAYGGEHESLSTVGALDAARQLGWDAILVGPGPGIIGSNTEFGHGGMAALDSAHAGLALKLPTILSPRLSSSDPRERHLHLSHHTFTVLECLLGPVEVAVPSSDLPGAPEAKSYLTKATKDRHHLHLVPADLEGYAASDLPTRTMGRTIEDDPLFFAAPLAAGTLLAAGGAEGEPPRAVSL